MSGLNESWGKWIQWGLQALVIPTIIFAAKLYTDVSVLKTKENTGSDKLKREVEVFRKDITRLEQVTSAILKKFSDVQNNKVEIAKVEGQVNGIVTSLRDLKTAIDRVATMLYRVSRGSPRPAFVRTPK